MVRKAGVMFVHVCTMHIYQRLMVRQLFGRISADFDQIFDHIEANLACAGGLLTRFLKFASHCRYSDVQAPKKCTQQQKNKKTLRRPPRGT